MAEGIEQTQAKAPRPPFSWAHGLSYIAAVLILVATFFPWFSPSGQLINAANQASEAAFSPMAQLFGGSGELITLKERYSIAEFPALVDQLAKLSNNTYAISAWVQQGSVTNNNSGGQSVPELNNQDGHAVRYEQTATTTLDSRARTNTTAASTFQQEIVFTTTMVELTEYAWLFSIALGVVGVLLSLLKRHVHAPMAVLISGCLCGLISVGWITLSTILLAPVGIITGVSWAPIISCIASFVIVILLTAQKCGPLQTWRTTHK